MTIEFQDGTNGLFDLQGKAFFAQQTILTALLTTIPAEIDDVWEIHDALATSTELSEAAIAGLAQSITAAKNGLGDVLGQLQQYTRAILTSFVEADNPQPNQSFNTMLDELIRQMVANSATVDASTVTASAAADADNTGDGRVVLSVKRGDGQRLEHALAETLEGEFSTNGRTAGITFRGEAAVPLLHPDWPQGSGATASVSSTDASASLLANGDFDDEDDRADSPDDIIFSVGTIATTVKMTNVEVQTLTVAGTPTSGHYIVSWTTKGGDAVSTLPLAYNASGATLQAALRKFPGLGSIAVTTSGTSPNFTHTITFTGYPGNPAQLTSPDTFDTGGVTPATTTAGTAQVLAGSKALHLDTDGAELTTFQWPLTTLTPETAYAFSLWSIADSAPAAGVITVDLVDGIGGSVIKDSQGMLNSFKFSATDLTTSWQHLTDLVAAVDEVQTLTITGTPTGGTFTITVDTGVGAAQTTAGIAFDADAATVQAALVALSNLITGDVSCGGGALPGTPVTITFAGRFAGRRMPLATADGASLTGGTTPDAAIALTTSGSSAETVFRTPTVLPDAVYLRVGITTAITSGRDVYLDEAALVRMTSLYRGGPLVSVFPGATEWKAGDKFTLTVTNDRAGTLQEFYHRNFDMASLGLLLPSDNGGGETVPDSVVG